jgi:hypothetical protein
MTIVLTIVFLVMVPPSYLSIVTGDLVQSSMSKRAYVRKQYLIITFSSRSSVWI